MPREPMVEAMHMARTFDRLKRTNTLVRFNEFDCELAEKLDAFMSVADSRGVVFKTVAVLVGLQISDYPIVLREKVFNEFAELVKEIADGLV